MNDTLPPIQPHTQAKHHILRHHLEEWVPILGRSSRLLMYIDGFSGPGEYEGGEIGSPLVALQSIRDHRYFNEFGAKNSSVKYLFVDRKANFIRHLESKIKESYWPRAFNIKVERGLFAEVMEGFLDDVDAGKQSMPPALIFIDPFGSAGFPMALMERLAAIDRVEVLINLNHLEFVQWILSDPKKYITADRLYGSSRWKPSLKLSGREQSRFLVTEYEKALGEIGWRCTSFEMVNSQNQIVYHLVFGTGSSKGLEAMKRAMRAASQTGEFRYTDRIKPSQPVFLGLDKENEYPIEVGDHLFEKYDGQEIHFDLLLDSEINWHRWWLPKDLNAGLRHLEYGDDPRIIDVRRDNGKRRRAKSYSDCHIKFGRKPMPQRLF